MKKFLCALLFFVFTVSCSFAATGSMTLRGFAPDGELGEYYTASYEVIGGTPPYIWTHSSGIPTGLDFNSNGSNASVQGIPEATGTFDFTVRVIDSNFNEAIEYSSVKIYNKGEKPDTPTQDINIEATLGDNGTVGTEYSKHYFVNAQGTAPYTWSLVKGSSIPPGLFFILSDNYSITDTTTNNNYLHVNGTPRTSGKYNFKVKITDSEGKVGVRDTTLNITGTQSAMKFSKSTLNNGKISSFTGGLDYKDFVTVEGGIAPYVWAISKGKLPDGTYWGCGENSYTVIRNKSIGRRFQIEGSTNNAGTFDFDLTVMDSVGNVLTQTFTITVKGEGGRESNTPVPTNLSTPTISGNFLSTGSVGEKYESYISVSSQNNSYTWAVSSGSLPPGLSLGCSDSSTPKKANTQGKNCFLSGVPMSGGNYNFSLKVMNGYGQVATKEFSISVAGNETLESDITDPEPEPEPEPEPIEIEEEENVGGSSGSGGGCEIGIGILGIAALSLIFKKREQN